MTIAEISKKYQLTQDTLRYYERIGLIPAIKRNASGFRDYDDQDCRRIEFVLCMRSAGLPIDVLIEYMRLYMQGDETIPARKDILVQQRDELAQRIADMQRTMERLNWKIANHERHIRAREDDLLK